MTLTSKPGELVRFLCFPEAVDVKPGYSLRSGLGLPGPDSSPDGCCMDGVSDRLGGSEGSPLSEDEGDADEGDSLEELEADALAEVGTGAGGGHFGLVLEDQDGKQNGHCRDQQHQEEGGQQTEPSGSVTTSRPG